MARLVRVTLFAVALAVATSMTSAEQVRNAHVASRTNFRAQQSDPYASSQPSEVTTAAPYSSQPAEMTTAAPYSSQPAEMTTGAPYSSQPTAMTTSAPHTTTKAPYSSQPAEITTAAPYATSTTAAPYSSQPAEMTTAAPYSSQPAEVTTGAPYASSTTAAPYSSQPAEVATAAPYATTAAPYSSQPGEVTTQAPAMSGSGSGVCQWVYIDAQFVLSGAGWTNVQANANAWASLSAAVTNDLASLLGCTQADISVKSITAANNALTIVFTARSDALAEAARIAALIRDDVPTTAPLPATDSVYASVGGQSAQDVNVTSHTGASRDMYDCTGTAAPSPSSSSNANEVTTQAPAGAASTSGSYAPSTSGPYAPSSAPSSAPSGSYTRAPSPSSYPVYSSLVLSGNGWQQIAASAWKALKAAVASDIAAALNMDSGSITINIMQATSTGLRVNYTVMTTSEQAAGSVSAQTSELDSSLQLPATSVLYQQANPTMKNATVAVAWSGSSSNNFYSPAGSMMSWMPFVVSVAAVAAVAALVQ